MDAVVGLTFSASVEIYRAAGQLVQPPGGRSFSPTARADGRSEFMRPNRSGDSHLFMMDTEPVWNGGLPRFGIQTTVAIWSKFLVEHLKTDVADVLDFVAWVMTTYPSRGYATYIEPVLFYWDRDFVVLNESGPFLELTEAVFASTRFAVVTAPLDIDVGYELFD